tara:strand:+ start:128 stop:1411 length:1284 start_codon:yes stop_codon:yes gene_type:complete
MKEISVDDLIPGAAYVGVSNRYNQIFYLNKIEGSKVYNNNLGYINTGRSGKIIYSIGPGQIEASSFKFYIPTSTQIDIFKRCCKESTCIDERVMESNFGKGIRDFFEISKNDMPKLPMESLVPDVVYFAGGVNVNKLFYLGKINGKSIYNKGKKAVYIKKDDRWSYGTSETNITYSNITELRSATDSEVNFMLSQGSSDIEPKDTPKIIPAYTLVPDTIYFSETSTVKKIFRFGSTTQGNLIYSVGKKALFNIRRGTWEYDESGGYLPHSSMIELRPATEEEIVFLELQGNPPKKLPIASLNNNLWYYISDGDYKHIARLSKVNTSTLEIDSDVRKYRNSSWAGIGSVQLNYYNISIIRPARGEEIALAQSKLKGLPKEDRDYTWDRWDSSTRPHKLGGVAIPLLKKEVFYKKEITLSTPKKLDIKF